MSEIKMMAAPDNRMKGQGHEHRDPTSKAHEPRSVPGFDVQDADLSGCWLLEASAGTGKTYALERIVLRLVIERAVSIDRILVVTFTNAATAELRERVRDLLHRAADALRDKSDTDEFEAFFARSRGNGFDAAQLLENALEHFDEASILTIHGFCQKMLSEFIFTRGGAFDVQFVSSTGFESQVTEEFLRNELPSLTSQQRQRVLGWKALPELLNKLCEHEQSVEPKPLPEGQDFDDPVLLELFTRFLTEAPARVRELERLHGVKSFSALLTDMYALIEKDATAAERIRERYEAVLVDEFQDTDRVQYKIFSRLFLQQAGAAAKCVFFVGDPKQAIYAFRGAELDVYLRARHDIEAMGKRGCLAGVRTLKTNYRSTPALVAAINAFFGASTQTGSFLTQEIRYDKLAAGASAKPLMRICDGRAAPVPVMSLWIDDGRLAGKGIDEVRAVEARYMADDIASLLDGTVYLYRHGHWRALRPGDIAVLVRARHEAAPVQQELLKHGIRTLLEDKTSVFSTAQAQDVITVFEAMLAPTDARKFAAARATRLIGRTIRELREDLAAAGADRELLKTAAERSRAWGPAAALSYIARQRNLQQRLLPVKGGAAMLMNYEQLGELLQEQYRRLGALGAVLRVMVRLRHSDDVEDNHIVRKPNDENVVRVVTIHASKGLEYPVVYLAQTESLKKKKFDNDSFWITSDQQSREVSVTANLESDPTGQAGVLCKLERLRQAYVAMTRASSRLVLPIFISAKGKSLSRTSASNAYVQAMTGKSEPVADLDEYVQVLDYLREAAQAVMSLYENAVKRDPCMLGVEAINETLRRDLCQKLRQPLSASAAGCLVEIKAAVEPAAAVTGSTSARVRALAPVRVPSAWHRSSFTAIAKSMGASVGEEFEAEEFEGEDALIELDEEAQQDAPEGVASSSSTAAVRLEQGDAASALALRLIRGAEAGDWIHKLFERVMNAAANEREAVLRDIEPHLAASTLLSRAEPEERPTVLRAAVELIGGYVRNSIGCELFNARTLEGIGCELNGGSFALSSLSHGEKLCEMPFLLSAPNKGLRAQSVAQCMSRSGYSMDALRDNALQGYLSGAIDMVFRAAGRFFILDWKSNWLGASTQDYSREAMRTEIRHKHYALQYVIYLVALKRHLIATAGYTEDNVWQAIGGAFYVFVRGVDAAVALDADGRRTGVYFDRPRQAVDALDALLKGNASHG